MAITCVSLKKCPRAPTKRFGRRVGIVMPAFNEREHLPALLRQCRAVQPAVVVVVDDASTDGTPRIAAAHGGDDTVVFLRNETNLGKQGSVRRGLRLLARRSLDAVAVIDGDGQHDPGELPALAELLDRYHAVIGARRAARMPAQRRLSNWLVNLGFELIGGINFVDVQSGLRLYRKAIADLLAAQLPVEGGYGLEHESLALLARHAARHQVPLRLVAAPISCAYGVARSTLGPAAVAQLAWETIRQALRIRDARQPLLVGSRS
jgi:glycosyltransferase involved in cell wall biosynthesis